MTNHPGTIETLLSAKRIAIVGLSDNPHRAAWSIASYLRSIGREIVPVNPQFEELMDVRCYPSISAVPEPVDLVDVFRRAEFCPEVVRDAIVAKAGGVWLQSGIVSGEALAIANEAKMRFVQDRCLMVDLMRALK